ncbi:uncharacterized protein LOC132828091 [Hemiscyllium ocellatum]|uniref:uncharacterized protein LOC132828091 n=1 Tax=Hemiscyllium ocellatum TaxID=170820 RepID=UPI0029663738|nr:uncharacterized protein LOC132828091 [Hemiscyllium ocellatum]
MSFETRVERLKSKIFENKTMWTLILLICSIPVSGALWAEKQVIGILGRAVTISCHYDAQQYQSYVKYWCQGWNRLCSIRAKTNWPNGRITITDDKTQGMFLVTITNLQWEDAGWYSCGIETFAFDPMFNVKLHISDEAVSVPGLRFLSQPNVSCSGGSVTVSCESAQGSLPIHYTWSEKKPSQDSKISYTNKLDLHCQSFTQQHHQYYCTASNTQGTKPSEIAHVSVHNVREKNCSYRIQINSIGREYTCDNSSTISTTTSPTATRTSSGPKSVNQSYIVWDVIRWVLFTLLVICSVSVTILTRKHYHNVYTKTLGEHHGLYTNDFEHSKFPINEVALGGGVSKQETQFEKNGAERLTSRTELILVNKTMWTLILLICSIPGAVWAEKDVTGILGRAITISCQYEARLYQSHKKYCCHGWTRLCKVIATTNWPNGRISITDNKTQGIFLVTITNLQWGDAGWYSCGIETPGYKPMFYVKLHISDEAVSVPGLRFLSQPNVSCSGGSVTVSCESAQGSLPIHYTWSEKMPSQDSKISDTNKLDLHCQSFTQQHHQYYCTASNTQGTKPSEIVHVSVNNVREKNCSYRIQINSIGSEYTCDKSTTISSTTTGTSSGPKSVSKSYVVWDVIRWVLFTLLVICSVSVTMFTQKH